MLSDTCCVPSPFQNSPSSHVDMIKYKCGFTRNMVRESNMADFPWQEDDVLDLVDVYVSSVAFQNRVW